MPEWENHCGGQTLVKTAEISELSAGNDDDVALQRVDEAAGYRDPLLLRGWHAGETVRDHVREIIRLARLLLRRRLRGNVVEQVHRRRIPVQHGRGQRCNRAQGCRGFVQ